MMVWIRFTVNEKRSMAAARAQQQGQEQQLKTESNNSSTDLRRPMLPPVLALPAVPSRNRSENDRVRYVNSNDENEQKERHRLVQRYSGGELQFVIDWFEHFHRDLAEISRDLDSIEEELIRSDI